MPANDHLHVPDADLVMAIDGELSPNRQREVDEHVRSCWRCRARQSDFEHAIESFIGWHGDLPVPPADGPRALLRASLAETQQHQPLPRPWINPGRVASAGIVCAASVAVAILVWTNLSGNLTAATPNPERTPGLTVPMTVADVCRPKAVDEHPTLPPALARRVFLQYGIRDPQPRSYEIDYLITPALGGAVDERNLWPQPYEAGVWNSRVKDALEEHLRKLVCRGQLSLTQAQSELSKDWVAAYKKYFRSNRPLAEHASFVKDHPWE